MYERGYIEQNDVENLQGNQKWNCKDYELREHNLSYISLYHVNNNVYKFNFRMDNNSFKDWIHISRKRT